MIKALTILLGSILTCILLAQIAANIASDIHYWEVGRSSSGQLLWWGVVAAGLLLGGSILVQNKPRIAAGAFVVSLPLNIVYQQEYARNLLSISMDRSVVTWLAFGTVVLIVLALQIDSTERALEV